jgi:hypothetical protein
MVRSGNRQAMLPIPKVSGSLPDCKYRGLTDCGRIRVGYNCSLQTVATCGFPSYLATSDTSIIALVDDGDDK